MSGRTWKALRLIMVVTACIAPAAFAQDVLIRGAKVHTVSARGTLDGADVFVRKGRVVAVGTGLSAPGGATEVEAGGRELTPGFFGGVSALGLMETLPADRLSTAAATQAGTAPNAEAWHPELDATLGFNPRSILVPVARIEGITWTMIMPSLRGIVAGQGAAVTLDGRFDAVLPGSYSLFIRIGTSMDAYAGGSRAGQFMLLEGAAREAKSSTSVETGALLRPAGREVFSRYLAGGRVIFAADRAVDIRNVVDFSRRHGMKPVILGGAEAWIVARELAEADVPVILDSLENLPADFDRLAARLDNARLLHEAGVRISFSNGDAHNARRIRQLAGNAVANGLPWDVALTALTATPADILGLNESRGSIGAGMIADLVLWDGDPLEVTTVAEQLWIAGVPIEMRSRQTELRDRYMD